MDKNELKKNIESFFVGTIRPAVQMDGGDIHLLGVKELKNHDGYSVQVSLDGACVGCGLAGITLSVGVEARLREKFPEIQRVEVVS